MSAEGNEILDRLDFSETQIERAASILQQAKPNITFSDCFQVVKDQLLVIKAIVTILDEDYGNE